MLPSPTHASGSSSLREWLEGHSLGRYASTFAYHHIAEDILPPLTEGDLNDMGVTAVGDRRRLLQSHQRFPSAAAAPASNAIALALAQALAQGAQVLAPALALARGGRAGFQALALAQGAQALARGAQVLALALALALAGHCA